MLERFFTDSYSGDKPVLRRVVAGLDRVRPSDAARRWLSRRADDLPPDKVTSFERLGFAYARARRGAVGSESVERVFAEFGRIFNQAVLRRGLGDAEVVFGFNRAGLELFEASRREGRRCVMDQTIAPTRIERDLLAAEVERWPGWQPDLKLAASDRAEARERREWEAVDTILCPSAFVRDGVATVGGPTEKCRVVPYGTDPARFPRLVERGAPRHRPFRVLFAGQVGLRKGVPYLLEALRRLGSTAVQARVVGAIALDRRKLDAFTDVATLMGPVPRPAMPEHFTWADVFVFPSLCEGSAAVLSEALTTGLPVICTPNSGPPPVAGGIHLVPAGDADALAEAILAVRDDYAAALPPLDDDPVFGLAAYGRRLAAAITEKPDPSSI